ncbi:MAG: YhfX family PLP-dependent enzyme [Lachnospiraceae bacterium]|nr:YhfX family PLP-dependent enzyme [Lachnospiraceae bacterium]
MFLRATEARNPLLIETAIRFHQQGVLQPDTYILDLDMIRRNAQVLLEEAKKYSISLFFMTKQIGRNPLVAKELINEGFSSAVVVDYREALVMMENNIPLGNVGHLVQIPKQLLKKIMDYGTEFITVYSIDKLKEINQISSELGIQQKVIIKILDKQDLIYDGQYGGFSLADIPNLVNSVKGMMNIELAGITSFPCFLLDQQEINSTQNLKTVLFAKKLLQDNGLPIKEINMPSATCVATIPKIRSFGGTQGEPGHALTGTTPLHALQEQSEKPAMVYVSEISHHFDGHSYLYGGGYYRRGHWENVIVVQAGKREYDKLLPFSDESIDYYLGVNKKHAIGATVIAAFRTQMFVTRSEIAVIDGIQKKEPKLLGIYDSQGRFLRGEK